MKSHLPLLLATITIVLSMAICTSVISHRIAEYSVPQPEIDFSPLDDRLESIEQYTCSIDRHLEPAAQQINDYNACPKDPH